MKSPHTRRREQLGTPLLDEQGYDPYRERARLSGATRCPDCGARFVDGRWTWQDGETEFTVECPACRRIRDGVPAGELVITIAAADPGLDAVLRRIDHLAVAERNEQPLHRIIDVRREEQQTVVTTTDIHLPHRFGHGLKDTWGGQVETHYDPAGYFARVVWRPARD